MKAVIILCLIAVAMARPQEPVHVVDNNGPVLDNVDPSFYQPTQGQLYNVDQAFYRPTIGGPPNGEYQPISIEPAYVENYPGGNYGSDHYARGAGK